MVTVRRHELKTGPSDMKFIALDHRMKTVSINDTVRVLEGPLKVWHWLCVYSVLNGLF